MRRKEPHCTSGNSVMTYENMWQGVAWARRGGCQHCGFLRCWCVHLQEDPLGHKLIPDFVSLARRGQETLSHTTSQPAAPAQEPASVPCPRCLALTPTSAAVVLRELHRCSQDLSPNALLSLFRHHRAKEEALEVRSMPRWSVREPSSRCLSHSSSLLSTQLPLGDYDAPTAPSSCSLLCISGQLS